MGPGAARTRPWVVVTGLALAAVVLYLALHAGYRAMHHETSDFRAYYTAAAEMRAGRDPYAPDVRPYLYPPLLASLLMPLTSLPMEDAALVFLPVLIAAGIGSVVLAPKVILERLGAPASSSSPGTVLLCQAVLLTLVLSFDRLKSDTQMFQVNCLMLFLFTVGLLWVDRRPAWAGSALGLALNIKGQSIVLLPYLLLRRRWRAAGAMVLSTVGFGLLPGLLAGWDANVRNVSHLLRGLSTLTGAHTPRQSTTHLVDVTAGFSISATSGVARMLGRAGHGYLLWPVMALIVLTLLAAGLRAYRRAGVPWLRWPDALGQQRQPWRALVAMEWTLLVLAVPIFSAQTNSRHLVLIVLPIAMAAAAIRMPAAGRSARGLAMAAAVVFLAALTFPPGDAHTGWPFELRRAWTFAGGPSWLLLAALELLLIVGTRRARDLAGKEDEAHDVAAADHPDKARERSVELARVRGSAAPTQAE